MRSEIIKEPGPQIIPNVAVESGAEIVKHVVASQAEFSALGRAVETARTSLEDNDDNRRGRMRRLPIRIGSLSIRKSRIHEVEPTSDDAMFDQLSDI